MKMIDPGELRHYIALQSSTETRGTGGSVVKSWSTHTSVWARVQPLTGQVALQAQQINAELTHRITIRYNSTLAEGDRVLWGSRIFDINVIRNLDERDIYQELLCKEARE